MVGSVDYVIIYMTLLRVNDKEWSAQVLFRSRMGNVKDNGSAKNNTGTNDYKKNAMMIETQGYFSARKLQIIIKEGEHTYKNPR